MSQRRAKRADYSRDYSKESRAERSHNSRQKTGKPAAETHLSNEDNHMHERNLYVTMNLVGHLVEVQVKDGSIFEGKLHTACTERGYGVVLKLARKKDPALTSLPSPIETLIIQPQDFVQLIAKDVNFIEDAPEPKEESIFKTDTDISRGKGELKERELKPWTPDEDLDSIPDHLTVGDTFNKDKGNWDQFAVNEKLFGVKSTFNEELYTTPLDRNSQFYKERELEARRIAGEITSKPSVNIHVMEERGQKLPEEMDEEDKYSAVLQDKYIPPAKRGLSETKNTSSLSPRTTISTSSPSTTPTTSALPTPTTPGASTTPQASTAPATPTVTTTSTAPTLPIPVLPALGSTNGQTTQNSTPPVVDTIPTVLIGANPTEDSRPQKIKETETTTLNFPTPAGTASNSNAVIIPKIASSGSPAPEEDKTTTAAYSPPRSLSPGPISSHLNLTSSASAILTKSGISTTPSLERRTSENSLLQGKDKKWPLSPSLGRARSGSGPAESSPEGSPRSLKFDHPLVAERLRHLRIKSGSAGVLSPEVKSRLPVTISDVSSINALNLDPSSPKVSEEVVREFQDFKQKKEQKKREETFADLKSFQQTYERMHQRNKLKTSETSTSENADKTENKTTTTSKSISKLNPNAKVFKPMSASARPFVPSIPQSPVSSTVTPTVRPATQTNKIDRPLSQILCEAMKRRQVQDPPADQIPPFWPTSGRHYRIEDDVGYGPHGFPMRGPPGPGMAPFVPLELTYAPHPMSSPPPGGQPTLPSGPPQVLKMPQQQVMYTGQPIRPFVPQPGAPPYGYPNGQQYTQYAGQPFNPQTQQAILSKRFYPVMPQVPPTGQQYPSAVYAGSPAPSQIPTSPQGTSRSMVMEHNPTQPMGTTPYPYSTPSTPQFNQMIGINQIRFGSQPYQEPSLVPHPHLPEQSTMKGKALRYMEEMTPYEADYRFASPQPDVDMPIYQK